MLKVRDGSGNLLQSYEMATRSQMAGDKRDRGLFLDVMTDKHETEDLVMRGGGGWVSLMRGEG